MPRVRLFFLPVVFLLIVSCSTTQSRYVMLGQSYPARPENCAIEVFHAGVPRNTFMKISRVDVHLERTGYFGFKLDDALPELKRQACLSGADAIIELHERSSSHVDTKIYHVTATGIKYRD